MTRDAEKAAASPLGALPLRFTKMSGAGNDFLVFGERVASGAKEIAAIRRLCRRGTGVGADGVLFVTAERPGDPSSRVVAEYLNADGSLSTVLRERHALRGPVRGAPRPRAARVRRPDGLGRGGRARVAGRARDARAAGAGRAWRAPCPPSIRAGTRSSATHSRSSWGCRTSSRS